MKTKKFQCECGGPECSGELKLCSYESNEDKQLKVMITVNSNPIVLSSYKLYRLRSWIDCAINEIENQEVKAELKKVKNKKSVKSVAKKK